MSKQEQELVTTVKALITKMGQMQLELDTLKQRTASLPQSLNVSEVGSKREVSTTRRNLLLRLAGGLVAGLAIGGVGASLPKTTEAKLFASTKGWGAVVVPPGGTFTGNQPTDTVYGLYATSDTSTDITNYLPKYKIAVVGVNASYPGSNTSYGVFGQAQDAGVYGTSNDDLGVGVYGASTGTAIYGYSKDGFAISAFSNNGYAGIFTGKVTITGGTFTKPGGSFKIDHPLDPANKYLYHSFVESPDMMNIYNGIATLDSHGEATVEMPDWFEALNFDFRYQLTCMDYYSQIFIAERIKDRKFKIAGGMPDQEISWQVTGIRQDEWAKTHCVKVEEDKPNNEKGKYLHPDLFGQPKEMAVYYRPEVREK